jgi:hypothetical protein
VAASTLVSTGCSFLFVKGPPDDPTSGRSFDCTSSRVAPALDTIFGGLEVVRVGVDTAVADSAFQGAPIGKGEDIAFGTVFAALFLGSAIYGYNATMKCSAASHGESRQQPDRSHESTSAEPHHPSHEGAASTQPHATPGLAPRPFNPQAARSAIGTALTLAAQACGTRGDLHGQGTMTLTYQPDGHVSNVLFAPAFTDATLQACVVGSLRAAVVPPYDGEALEVRKRFDFGGTEKGADPSAVDAGAAIVDAGPSGS